MTAPDASGLREAARTTSHGDVEEFNRDCPIGTAVLAFPGSRDGRALMTRTRSTAWLVGREPVVMVEGYAGGIALTHIEVVPATPDACARGPIAASTDASGALSEAERESLARVEFLTWAGMGETYGIEWADHLTAAVERIVAARVSAAATRARAEGAAEAAERIAQAIEAERDEYIVGEPQWLSLELAADIARGDAAVDAGGRP